MSVPEEPSRPGARLADREEQRRKFCLPPLRRLLPKGRYGATGAEQEGPEQKGAWKLRRGAFVLFLVSAALLALVMTWNWLY